MIDLIRDFSAGIADGRVWMALALPCVAVFCLLLPIGVPISRRTGLLAGDAESSETFSIGLSIRLIAFAAVWASIASLGARGTPVLVSILIRAA